MARRKATGVEKLGDKLYRIRWTERGTGKERSKRIHGTEDEAKTARAAVTVSQARGEYVSADQRTLEAWLREWLNTRELLGITRTSTHERYCSLLGIPADKNGEAQPARKGSLTDRLGAIRLQALSESDLDSYYLWCLRNERDSRRKSGSGLVGRETVRKRHKVVHMALAEAVRKRLTVRNPAADATPPKQEKASAQFFTLEEAEKVLAAVYGGRIEVPVRIALFTGLRIGEVLGLRWRDLELPASGEGRLTVSRSVTTTKGSVSLEPYAKTDHSRRAVTFDADLAAYLTQHRKEQAEAMLAAGPAWERNDLVVCGTYGQIVRPAKVSPAFSAALAMLEDHRELSTHGATFHSLRHTHATLLLKALVPPHVVSKRLGHSTVAFTLDRYAHVIPSQDADAAAVLGALFAHRIEPAIVRLPSVSDTMRAAEAAL